MTKTSTLKYIEVAFNHEKPITANRNEFKQSFKMLSKTNVPDNSIKNTVRATSSSFDNKKTTGHSLF